ncbi:MAG: hypothetical protein HYX75_16515 [Acidobacteria bacterium]|nr:hypothetical protein [Acidobacteriota bacterium]
MRINNSNPFARNDGGMSAGAVAKKSENNQGATAGTKPTRALSATTRDSYERNKPSGVFDQQPSFFRPADAGSAGASESQRRLQEAGKGGSLPRIPELPADLGALKVPMKSNGVGDTIMEWLDNVANAQAVVEGVTGDSGSSDPEHARGPCILCDDPHTPEWAKAIVNRAVNTVTGGDITEIVESVAEAALGQRGDEEDRRKHRGRCRKRPAKHGTGCDRVESVPLGSPGRWPSATPRAWGWRGGRRG